MANTVKIGISASDEGFKSTMQQAASSVAGLGSAMSGSAKQFSTVNGALRAARKEAIELTAQWRALDEEAQSSDFGQSLQAQLQSVLQTAGELQDIKADVASEIKNLASDTTMWDGMAQGIGVVSSSMQGLAGVVGLLGGDVQAFTQALTVMNTVQSVTNTIIGIGNALQKDSALMVALRAAKTAILTTAEGAAATAITAETAATEAQTVAQIANNAAVMANPYVLAAAAIVALTAAIVAWIVSIDDATDSEIAAAAAVDAFNEQVDQQMKVVGEQINLYDDLKRQYDSCGGKVDQFAKKLINNTEVQKKLGVTVKTVDDVHALFAKHSETYKKACMLRASAMAAEAAQAALLGATLSELSKIQAKLMAGQEVNWRDMRKVVEAAGYSSKAADDLMKAAGYVYEGDGIAYGDIKQGTGDIAKLMEGIANGGAYKALQDMSDKFTNDLSTLKEENIDFGRLLNDNLNVLDATDKSASKAGSSTAKAGSSAAKAGKDAAKGAASTKEQIKEILTTLEGCDAIIQHAEKDIKKLDKSAGDYNKKLQSLKNTILTARIAKLDLLDKTTLKGLLDYKKNIQDIIDMLPDGSPQIENLNKMLSNANKQIEEIYGQRIASGKKEDLDDLKKYYSELIPTLRHLSDAQIDALRKLKGVEDQLKQIEREEQNVKLNIHNNSVTRYQQELDDALATYNEWINNQDINLVVRMGMEIDDNGDLTESITEQLWNAVEEAKANLGAAKTLRDSFAAGTRTVSTENRYDVYDTRKAKWQLSTIWEWMQELEYELRELNDIKVEIVGETEYNKAQQRIAEINEELSDLKEQQEHLNIRGGDIFDYKSSPLDNIQRDIDKIIEKIEKLNSIKLEDVGQDAFDEAQADLTKYFKILKELQKEKVNLELSEDLKEFNKQFKNNVIDVTRSGIDGIKSIYDSITGLADEFDNAENPIETFFAVFDTIFTIVDAVKSFIDAINAITETIRLLSGVNEAIAVQAISSNAELTAAYTASAAAEDTKAASDAASIAPLTAKAGADKLAAAAAEELAAANMFAANSEIPIVGAAIGAAEVAIMEGVLTGIKATQLLAGGGIVQGSTTMGDRMLVGINAGEMVLNKRQQANLFKALDQGVGTSQGYTVSNVRVKGSDIYLALKNYSKIKGKSGLTTGIQ